MNPGTALPPRSAGRKLAPNKLPNKSPKNKFRWGRFFLLLLLMVLLLCAGYAGYLYWKGSDALGNIDITDNNAQVISPAVPPSESVNVKPTTVLLMGLDTRKQTGSMNTDVMMVATFNPETKSAVVVSIPRDTKIELDGYKARKANAYYARFTQVAHDDEKLTGPAAEKYARDEMKQMLGKYFGITIDYTAIINFQGFADVVDALGGVDVDVDMDMKYKDTADGTNINLKKGPQKLDGDDALDFVRYRKSNEGTGASSDFDRNKRQSDVLGALTDKMKSLSGIAKLGNVIDAVGGNLTMDMPSKEIEKMMKTYFRISKENIQFIPLDGTWRSPYVYADEAKLDQARTALQDKAMVK